MSALLVLAAEETRELPAHPIVYGVVSFALLLALLLGVLMFGKGRPHA